MAKNCTGCNGKLKNAKSNPDVIDPNTGLVWHSKCLSFHQRMKTHGDAFRTTEMIERRQSKG